jgi:hypothetical protein
MGAIEWVLEPKHARNAAMFVHGLEDVQLTERDGWLKGHLLLCWTNRAKCSGK